MIYIFRQKNNHDDQVFLDAPTKAEALKKLRAMSSFRGHLDDYEEVVFERVSKRKDNPGSE